MALASEELEGQGPFWKEKFAVIPAPPDESGFMTGQQSPGRRSVEVRDTSLKAQGSLLLRGLASPSSE